MLGGECKIFEAPKYEVRGARPYDQDWIDSNIEGGVGGCGWSRPQKRPASIDVRPAAKPVVAPDRKKVGIIKRIKDRVMPATKPEIVAPPPMAVEPVVPSRWPVEEPRDPVDELLNPKER